MNKMQKLTMWIWIGLGLNVLTALTLIILPAVAAFLWLLGWGAIVMFAVSWYKAHKAYSLIEDR